MINWQTKIDKSNVILLSDEPFKDLFDKLKNIINDDIIMNFIIILNKDNQVIYFQYNENNYKTALKSLKKICNK